MAHLSSAQAKQLACVLIISLVVIATPARAAVTCNMVLSSLSPCLNYLKIGGAVPPSCCDGARSLNNAASTTPDVQAACRCIKSLAPGVGAKAEFINSLPGICNVNIPYKYSPSLDCSKVVR